MVECPVEVTGMKTPSGNITEAGGLLTLHPCLFRRDILALGLKMDTPNMHQSLAIGMQGGARAV